jgi:hypothetical protein
MDFPKLSRELIIAFLTTVVAGVVSAVIETMIGSRLLTIATFTTIMAVILVFYLIHYYREQSHMLGITKVFRTFQASPTTEELLEGAPSEVWFLGISAKTFFDKEETEPLVRQKLREGCRFRFLLLDPRSRFLELKANDEGDDPKAWRHDITASVTRLRKMQKDFGPDVVGLREYDEFPVWRFVVVDRRLMHITYYPHGHRGTYSPVAILMKEEKSMFAPLCQLYQELWERSHEP